MGWPQLPLNSIEWINICHQLCRELVQTIFDGEIPEKTLNNQEKFNIFTFQSTVVAITILKSLIHSCIKKYNTESNKPTKGGYGKLCKGIIASPYMFGKCIYSIFHQHKSFLLS